MRRIVHNSCHHRSRSIALGWVVVLVVLLLEVVVHQLPHGIHGYVPPVPATTTTRSSRTIPRRFFVGETKQYISDSSPIVSFYNSNGRSNSVRYRHRLAMMIPSPQSSTSIVSSAETMSPLMTYFWQTVIANGIPAAFALLVIGFTALQFRGGGSRRDRSSGDGSSASGGVSSTLQQLYDDIYGDQDQDPLGKNTKMLNFFSSSRDKKDLPKNTGVPKKQYIQITNLNQKYDSYQYSVVAATQTKAVAAAQYRQIAFDRAIGQQLSFLSPSVIQELQNLEQSYLKKVIAKQQEIQYLQSMMQQLAIDEEMERMGMKSIYQLDPPSSTEEAIVVTNSSITDDGGETMVETDDAAPSSAIERFRGSWSKEKKNKKNARRRGVPVSPSTIASLQASLLTLETEFVRRVIKAVGPTHAAAVRTALLGNGGLPQLPVMDSMNTTTTMATSAASSTSNSIASGVRPLTRLLVPRAAASADESSGHGGRVFVTRFPGDATASQVANLREEITAIVQNCRAGDQVIVVLQTGGGTVTGYGLAAAQLQRIKDAGLYLTIAVEQVAASGGYMMACIADKIIASPFAVLGSIGVISDIPNVYNRLKQEGIEFQTVTAGKYKRTLTPTKKVTNEDYQKTKQDIENVFFLFRDFVAANRPQLDIEKVATGETWFGTAALELNLCDEIKTADDVILDFVKTGHSVFEVKYKPPPTETALGLLLPVGETVDDNGPVGGAIRWFVQTVASAVKSELCALDVVANKPIEERYLAVDETADQVRAQD